MACTIVNPLTMLALYGSREYNMNFYGSLQNDNEEVL